MRECALTTTDNPYDPLDENQFTRWFLFDVEKGYNSCGYLARIARTSDQFSDEENAEEIERAINEIVELDFTGLYRKVVRTSSMTETESTLYS